MADLKISLACQNYDRTRGLRDGSVRADGIEIEHHGLVAADIFRRLIKDGEFDAGELGLSLYLATLAQDNPPFIAIPIFPTRVFRHSAIFVNTGAGIASPRDLIGKKVGELLTYGHDAGVWAKGILSDAYGVPCDSVSYLIGGVDRGYSVSSWLPLTIPAKISVQHIGPNRTLDAMLDSGEIAALYSAVVPPALIAGSTNVARLFPDAEAVERDYFKRTGIFPIMHTIVLRRELYQRHPWVARALAAAFAAAKEQAAAFYRSEEAHLHRLLMLPWIAELYEKNRKLMGEDYWPYGVAANRACLDTFLRYHHEQGLSPRRFTPEEIFAPETLDL